MIINEVFSVRKDAFGSLAIDIDFDDDLGANYRSTFIYRASDKYSPLTPLITQWIADNNPVILPYEPPPPPTPEEMRERMPPITKRQLRLTLVRNGISLAQVEASIAAMPEGLEKQEAEIEWQDASEFTRLHPTLLVVAEALSLAPEQIDAMWQQALTT